MARAPLFVRKQIGGVYVAVDESNTTGEIFFVHSGTGTDSVTGGKNPDMPLATLDFAVGLCTTLKGDTIYLMPGHAENVASTTACVLDKAGVRVIGLGQGTLKPTFTITQTTGTFSVTLPNCWVENIRIVADIDNVAKGITLGSSADGCTLKNVEIVDGATNKEFLIAVSIGETVSDLTFDGLKIFGLAGGATAGIGLDGAADRMILRNSYIQGTFSTALIKADSSASVNLAIHDNYLVNRDAAAGLVFKGHATNSGFMFRNFVAGTKNNTETINTPGTMHFAENYGTDTVATSGILTPATLTAWS